MAVATVITTKGKAMLTDRQKTSPSTYTTAPKWIGHGTGGGSRTAASSDTALTTEADTRAVGTESVVTTSSTGDTYQTSGTISPGGTETLNEAGTFDALTTGNLAVSATFASIGVVSGDTITYTFKTALS